MRSTQQQAASILAGVVRAETVSRPRQAAWCVPEASACRQHPRLPLQTYSETGDARVLPIMRALTAFFEGRDVVAAEYALDGHDVAEFSHLAFTAPVCCLFKVRQLTMLAGNY